MHAFYVGQMSYTICNYSLHYWFLLLCYFLLHTYRHLLFSNWIWEFSFHCLIHSPVDMVLLFTLVHCAIYSQRDTGENAFTEYSLTRHRWPRSWRQLVGAGFFFMQKIEYSDYRGAKVIAIFAQMYCEIPLVIICDFCCYCDSRVKGNYSRLAGTPPDWRETWHHDFAAFDCSVIYM